MSEGLLKLVGGSVRLSQPFGAVDDYDLNFAILIP